MNEDDEKFHALREAVKELHNQTHPANATRQSGIISGPVRWDPATGTMKPATGGHVHVRPTLPLSDAEIARALLEKAAAWVDPDNLDYAEHDWSDRLDRSKAYQAQAEVYAQLDSTAAMRDTAAHVPWVSLDSSKEGENK